MALLVEQLAYLKGLYAWRGHLDEAQAAEGQWSSELVESLRCSEAQVQELERSDGLQKWLLLDDKFTTKIETDMQEETKTIMAAVINDVTKSLSSATAELLPVAKGGADSSTSWRDGLADDADVGVFV